MGLMDDAKETAQAAGKKISRAAEDTVDKAKDKFDEASADAKVKKAEAERDSVERRNDAKDKLRD